MLCPHCSHPHSQITNKRPATLNNIEGVRRRHECLSCHQRFSTFEYICEIPRGNVPRNVFHPGYDPIAKKNGAPKTDLKNKVKQALIRAKQRIRQIG